MIKKLPHFFPFKVCIKNLLFKTTKADLLDFFQHCGDISVRHVVDINGRFIVSLCCRKLCYRNLAIVVQRPTVKECCNLLYDRPFVFNLDGCASCGIAFLRFDTPRAATCAVEKDGFFFNQRKIRVRFFFLLCAGLRALRVPCSKLIRLTITRCCVAVFH